MLDTLQKMSGTTHRSRPISKTVTIDKSRLFFQKDPTRTINVQTSEEPVITYNDMAFITERNSMVFRAGDSPVWNRNETILPMSWRLFKNTIVHPGHDYTLQTIPTLSSVLDFDVRKNQPNFQKMLDKRMDQATMALTAMQAYAKAYGYTDYDVEQLDPDVYADDVMQVINGILSNKQQSDEGEMDDAEFYAAQFESLEQSKGLVVEDNAEVIQAAADANVKLVDHQKPRYAGGLLSRESLVSISGQITHAMDDDILRAYHETVNDFARDRKYFVVQNQSLYGADGKLYIKKNDATEGLRELAKASEDPKSRVYCENGAELRSVKSEDMKAMGSYEIQDEFYRFLVSMESWTVFANGRFEKEMARLAKN